MQLLNEVAALITFGRLLLNEVAALITFGRQLPLLLNEVAALITFGRLLLNEVAALITFGRQLPCETCLEVLGDCSQLMDEGRISFEMPLSGDILDKVAEFRSVDGTLMDVTGDMMVGEL